MQATGAREWSCEAGEEDHVPDGEEHDHDGGRGRTYQVLGVCGGVGRKRSQAGSRSGETQDQSVADVVLLLRGSAPAGEAGTYHGAESVEGLYGGLGGNDRRGVREEGRRVGCGSFQFNPSVLTCLFGRVLKWRLVDVLSMMLLV